MNGSVPLAVSMFFLGVLHGLEPGHGKTIVATYLVGRRGRNLDVVYLGAVVAFSHSAVIIALATLSSLMAERFRSDVLVSRFELGSGALVVAVGLMMIWRRLRRAGDCCEHAGCGHHHRHHDHALGNATAGTPSVWSLTALGVTGGIVPCPTAIAGLLGSISMGRLAQGTGLVLVFSLGMATVLIAVGLVVVRTGDLARRWLDDRHWKAYVPLVSALLVTLLGIGMIAKSLIGPLGD